MTTRRRFFQTAAGGALTAASCSLVVEGASSRPLAPYRVLFSNDTTNITSCTSPWRPQGEPFREKYLQATVDEVAGKGVEVHLLQPGLGWIPWWKSSVYPADEHYRWFEKRTGLKADSYGKYMMEGGDMVAVFIARCRERGQAPFISLRMNDGHHLEFVDAPKPDRRMIWLSKFYLEHPEYRLGPDIKRREQHVLNWSIPAVRAHKFAFIRELCENYDFDGFEMDFMRHFSYFPLDQTTSAERSRIMTDFVRDVRAVLDHSSQDGRYRWLCARVPCYTAALDALGLDLPALVEAGLDMVNVSPHYFTIQKTDFAAIRQSISGGRVYLEMCHSLWNGRKPPASSGYDTFPFRRTTPEQYYTTAHLCYARGGDGVSTFNFVYYREHGGKGRGDFGEPPFFVFEHLGDRDWLARQSQHWFLAPGWAQDFERSPLPRKVKAGSPESFTLDLAPPTGGWKEVGRLRIQGEVSLGESHWTARLNGEGLVETSDISEPYPNSFPTMLGQPKELRAWSVPPALLHDGLNTLEFSLADGPEQTIAFLDLALPAADGNQTSPR